MSPEKVIACIKSNKHFLITTHLNLEGDALGSEIAFFRLLKSMGKQASIINQDSTPPEYNFLPGINKIKKFLPRRRRRIPQKAGEKNYRNTKFDCFAILDCSDLRRCGDVAKINIDNKPILNIDHHISNERFGDVNWIEPNASSTAEMIYKLYRKLHLPIDRNTAIALYVGILTDTGSFHYPNTNSLTHRVVSDLLRFNLNIAQIYKNIYENIPFEGMKLLSRILPTMTLVLKGKVVWFQIKQDLLKKHKGIFFDLTEHVLNFARAIKDTEVAVIFKENLGAKQEVRVNLRSQGKIDVNRIARFFGGGGHKTASGATVRGKIEDVRLRVLNKIKESFK